MVPFMPIVLVFLFSFFITSVQAKTSPDFENLHKTALIASAAYEQYEVAQTQLEYLGWALNRHFELPQNSVQYLLLSNGREQVIAIRGTANANNVMVDLDLQLVPDAIAGVQIHQGFSSAAQSVWQDVQPKLNKQLPIRTTGHSLGGAVAVVIAMYLQQEGYQLKDVITFGQPKVTNVEGAGRYESMPLTRVVTPLDLVPIVPPLSPLELKRLDIYWHNGEEIILNAPGQFSRVSGMKSMLRASKFLNKVPDETNAHAHEMQTYLMLLDANQKGHKEIPYKMEINLFGFSVE